MPHAILLTRFSLFLILKERLLHSGKNVYYFDLYGYSNGLFLSFLCLVFGRRKTSLLLETLGKILATNLRRVPHGCDIPDYHVLHLEAERTTKEYLTQYWKSDQYMPGFYLPNGVMDRECMDSLILKEIGWRFWHVIENLQVIKSLDAFEDLTICLDRKDYPPFLIEEIERRHNTQVVLTRPRDRWIVAAYVLCLAILCAVRNLVRLRIRPKTRGNTSDRLIAVEFVDPNRRSGHATEPNYLVRGGIPAKNILAYYRRKQKKLGRRDAFELPDKIHVVDLGNQPRDLRDCRILFVAIGQLLRQVWTRDRPSYFFLREVDNLQTFIDLCALFRNYAVIAHVYNTIPNGRVATRLDSGAVTGACRRFGIFSANYQSRFHYRETHYHFFDAFDAFFMWGEAWVDNYRQPQFIKHFGVIGNVNLDGPIASNYSATNVKAFGSSLRNLVVFTGDIGWDNPSHFTAEYEFRFLSDVAEAVGQHNRETDGMSYRIILKTKDPEHVHFFLNHEVIRETLERHAVKMVTLVRNRHDVAEALQQADKVLAIGFTSLGLDALSLGLACAYYTPYRIYYNRVLAAGTIPVLHDIDELKCFLGNNTQIDPATLNRIDPYMDSRAGVRLVEELCKHIELGTTRLHK